MVARLCRQGSRWAKVLLGRRGNVAPIVARRECIKRRAVFAALSVVASVTTSSPVVAAEPGSLQQVDGLAIYFAAVPAEFVLGHPAEHTGRGMHGGAPDGHYVHHLLVAVFDAATGKRITDASVTAVVRSGLHRSQGPIELGPMMLGGAQAYGGFAEMPPRDRYRIEIEVVRPGAAAVRAVFSHQHLQPQP